MTDTPPAAPAAGTPKGIGGWLILPALGLAVSPLMILVFTIRDVLPAFESETWAVLTTPGSNVYHPSTASLLIFEVVVNVVLFVLALVVNYFFWTKSRRLPKLISLWLLLTAVLIGIDTFWALQIPFVADSADGSYYRDFIRAVVGAVIWIPYFHVSKRVKNTFVE